MQTLCEQEELAQDLIDWQARDFTGKSKYRWKYIGEGTYRIVYRGPDGLVYKIPFELDDEFIGGNEEEFKNWKRIVQLPDFSWRGNKWKVLPKVELFTFPHIGEFNDGNYASVIVMPYVKGSHPTECLDNCGTDKLLDCLEYDQANTHYGLIDLSSDNVLVLRNGTRVIVDMEC